MLTVGKVVDGCLYVVNVTKIFADVSNPLIDIKLPSDAAIELPVTVSELGDLVYNPDTQRLIWSDPEEVS